MANDRVYLLCPACGEKKLLYSTFAEHGTMWKAQEIEDFLGRHIFDCQHLYGGFLGGTPPVRLVTESAPREVGVVHMNSSAPPFPPYPPYEYVSPEVERAVQEKRLQTMLDHAKTNESIADEFVERTLAAEALLVKLAAVEPVYDFNDGRVCVYCDSRYDRHNPTAGVVHEEDCQWEVARRWAERHG
jgi:hypothetical protein